MRYPAASTSRASFLITSRRAYTRSTWRCSAAISSAAADVVNLLLARLSGHFHTLGVRPVRVRRAAAPGAGAQHEGGTDAEEYRHHQRDPREALQPPLGRP